MQQVPIACAFLISYFRFVYTSVIQISFRFFFIWKFLFFTLIASIVYSNNGIDGLNEGLLLASSLKFEPHTNYFYTMLFAGFTHFQNLMREREAVGVGLLGTTGEEGKPSQRMLPQGC